MVMMIIDERVLIADVSEVKIAENSLVDKSWNSYSNEE